MHFRKPLIQYRNSWEVALLQRSTERLDIDLLVLPDTNLILIASVIEPLRGANRISGSELYRWRLLTPDGAPVPTTSHIAIPAEGLPGDDRG